MTEPARRCRFQEPHNLLQSGACSCAHVWQATWPGLLRTCGESCQITMLTLVSLLRRAGGAAGFKAAEQLATLLQSAGAWAADSGASAAIPNGRSKATAAPAAAHAASAAASGAAASEPEHARPAQAPPVHLVGFSKGGVLLNQLLTELSELYRPGAWAPGSRPPRAAPPRFDAPSAGSAASSTEETPPLPGSQMGLAVAPAEAAALLRAIASVHYIDAGVNSRGAYLTDPQVCSVHTAVKTGPKRIGGKGIGQHPMHSRLSRLAGAASKHCVMPQLILYSAVAPLVPHDLARPAPSPGGPGSGRGRRGGAPAARDAARDAEAVGRPAAPLAGGREEPQPRSPASGRRARPGMLRILRSRPCMHFARSC